MDVAIRVDVDTHRGLGEGVPRLSELLRDEQVTASFFIAMGPDNSGRAVVRAFRNRGFLAKMMRTRAVSTYGLRTILSGTLLPARQMALAFPGLVAGLVSDGFEVGVHGYDHVRWQDRIDSLGDDQIEAEIDDASEVYRAVLGSPPASFAAPGWRTSQRALLALDKRGLSYRSDTRGRTPYRCAVDGAVLVTPEIPTTLPTLDEVMGRRAMNGPAAVVNFFKAQFAEDTLNVYTIHAEVEGMGQLETFRALVMALKGRGARFLRLDEVAGGLQSEKLPVCEVTRTTIPGRGGWVSAQGNERT